MNATTMIVLSRYGDILNCLPMAYAYHKRGGKMRWLVSKEHASMFTGVSYVEPEEWPGDQDTLQRAIQHVRRNGQRALVAQAWKNPDQRHLCDSFAKEQWRLAGMQEHYGKYPLVIDRRFASRELELIQSSESDWFEVEKPKRPIILVSTTSISTPYKYADKLIATIRGLDAEVIDLDNVRAKEVYDLLGLFERADCLVSIDTMHHHLARAAYLPVVYLQNDGWKGASPVPQVRASWRYSELKDLQEVKAATEKIISRSCRSLSLVVLTYPKGHTDRHARAMATHPPGTVYAEFDDKRLTMKQMLSRVIDSGSDGVVYTNDDVTFHPDTMDRIKAHLSKWDFGCSRRPRDPVHIGREILWFRTKWLKEHWDEMPDPYWGLQRPDLIMARWMRKQLGIPTTEENLNYDFAPVEIPSGLIYHEDHESHWNNPEVWKSPEGQHNERLWEALA